MRTLLLTAALAWLSAFAAAQTKIGHVNTGLILESLPETAAADSAMLLYRDSLRAGLQGLEAEFQTKLDSAEAQQQNLTPKQLQTIQQELQELQQQIQVYQQESARMFEERRGRYIQPLVARLQTAVERYAKANGYNLVLDASLPGVLLFAEESVDLTEEIQSAME